MEETERKTKTWSGRKQKQRSKRDAGNKAGCTNHAIMDQLPQLAHAAGAWYVKEEPQTSVQHEQKRRWQWKDQNIRHRTKTDQGRQQLLKKPVAEVSMSSGFARMTDGRRCRQGGNLEKRMKKVRLKPIRHAEEKEVKNDVRQQRSHGSMNAGIEHPREKRVDERIINSRKLIPGRPSISFSRPPYENSRKSLRKKRNNTSS